jgi:HPt (histidine-containing phosphotransfer) domain-containing protein
VGDNELLQMLAAETERRTPAIVEGLRGLAGASEPNPGEVEAIRVEAHGLKGAAMVVGQGRLSELAQQVEIALVQRIAPGTLDPDLAGRLVAAIEVFQQGVKEAAAGNELPATVEEHIADLQAAADD